MGKQLRQWVSGVRNRGTAIEINTSTVVIRTCGKSHTSEILGSQMKHSVANFQVLKILVL